MHRIDGILLSLKPVARDFGENDLPETVLPCKRLPGRNGRRRQRPQVRPDETGLRLQGVGPDANLVLESGIGNRDIVIWLLHTPARAVEHPSVIVTPEAALFHETVGQVGAPMSALPFDEPECALAVFVEDKIFTQEANRLRPFTIEFG